MNKAIGIGLILLMIVCTWKFILAIGIIAFLLVLYGLFTTIF